MIVLKNLSLLFLICLWCCSVIAQEDLEIDENLQLVESLEEASFTNASAIESGDVLWKSSFVFDSTELESLNRPNKDNPEALQPGKLMVHEAWNRLIFDHNENRFFYIRRKIYKLNDFHDDANEPVLKVFWEGIVHDGKNQIMHRTSQPGSKESRALGVNERPGYLIPDARVAFAVSISSLAELESTKRDFLVSGTIKKLEVTDKSYVVLFEWGKDHLDEESGEKPEETHFSEVRYDIHSLQRTSMNAWVISQGRKLQSGKRKIKWTELNGLFVPLMTSDESATRLIVYGEPTFGMVEEVSSFHWFSVNEGVDHANHVFNGEPFESIEAFERMLDPVETNATHLNK